jgi:hypothetical protein
VCSIFAVALRLEHNDQTPTISFNLNLGTELLILVSEADIIGLVSRSFHVHTRVHRRRFFLAANTIQTIAERDVRQFESEWLR